MKKGLLYIMIMLLSFMLFACSQIGSIRSGATIGDGSSWPGCVEISLTDKVYDLDEKVNLYFSYGHDYDNDAEYHGVISHDLIVYVIDGNQTNIDPENGIILYEDHILEDDLFSDDYRCDPGKWIFSRVKYVNAYEVSIDFNDYAFDNGLIIIRFYETFMMEDNINGELVYTETTHFNQAFIYFLIDDETVEFSKRSFI